MVDERHVIYHVYGYSILESQPVQLKLIRVWYQFASEVGPQYVPSKTVLFMITAKPHPKLSRPIH